jgi:hypothetical protein
MNIVPKGSEQIIHVIYVVFVPLPVPEDPSTKVDASIMLRVFGRTMHLSSIFHMVAESKYIYLIAQVFVLSRQSTRLSWTENHWIYPSRREPRRALGQTIRDRPNLRTFVSVRYVE